MEGRTLGSVAEICPIRLQHLLLLSLRLFPPESFGFGGGVCNCKSLALIQPTGSRLVSKSNFWPATAVPTSPENLTRFPGCIAGLREWRKREGDLCSLELSHVWGRSTEEVPLELGEICVKTSYS